VNKQQISSIANKTRQVMRGFSNKLARHWLRFVPFWMLYWCLDKRKRFNENTPSKTQDL